MRQIAVALAAILCLHQEQYYSSLLSCNPVMPKPDFKGLSSVTELLWLLTLQCSVLHSVKIQSMCTMPLVPPLPRNVFPQHKSDRCRCPIYSAYALWNGCKRLPSRLASSMHAVNFYVLLVLVSTLLPVCLLLTCQLCTLALCLHAKESGCVGHASLDVHLLRQVPASHSTHCGSRHF